MIYSDKTGGYAVKGIGRSEALDLTRAEGAEFHELLHRACQEMHRYMGRRVDLCSIINAKSGACPEDCSFCAQSARSRTGAPVYPLIDEEKILDAANESLSQGVRRFCIVTSGRSPDAGELKRICGTVSALARAGISPCATLGMLDMDELEQLKDAGLSRYHHNLETSEAYFSEICSTHTYKDKLRTIESAGGLGLSVCSGGIFGLGESWRDRVDMAFALRDAGVDSVPINFLTPVDGTPLGSQGTLSLNEALKIISIYRLIMPDRQIRVCGGRPAVFGELSQMIFIAGADGLLVGNYLTTTGAEVDRDLRMIRTMGFEV